MNDTERKDVAPRVLWAAVLLAGLVLAGIALFFIFAGRTEPLISSASALGTITP